GQRGFRIAVKRHGDSADASLSHFIARGLHVGDRLMMQGPGGRFRLPLRSRHPVVLIAAGIGITPFMGYLETLCMWQPRFPVVLYYGNSSGRSHAFRERLAELCRQLPQLSIINHYSRPEPSDQSHFQIAGRIDAAAIADDLIAARARFYLCGPVAM